MKPDLLICPEQASYEEQIRLLISRAFAVAVHADGNEAEIVSALRDRGDLSVSLIALVNNKVVGHVAMSPVLVGGLPSELYCLAPLSVAPELQGQGIGTALVRAALDALPSDAKGVVVLGDPVYYSKFGFVTSTDITLPGVPAEYFQILKLNPVIEKTGEVSFSPAFGL